MQNVDSALAKLDCIRDAGRFLHEMLSGHRKLTDGWPPHPDQKLRRIQTDAYARVIRELEAFINKLKYDSRAKPPADVKEYLRVLRSSIPTSVNGAHQNGKAAAPAPEALQARSTGRRKKRRSRDRSAKANPAKSAEALHGKSTT